jgi:predicted neuraminidase
MMRRGAILVLVQAVVLTAFVQAARSFDMTVYALADGVIRPSHLAGAKEAFLPVILPSSHASNLLALPNGDLLCFWFAGTWEGRSGVSIVMSRLNHGSHRWSQPVELSHRSGWSNQNPVPFRAPDGRLWLFHTSQKAGKGEGTAVMFYLTSDDEGRTWTTPKPLFQEPGSFDRQHLVVFHRAWLFPTYQSGSPLTAGTETNYSLVKISKDGAKSWTSCKVPRSRELIQMDIVKVSPDHLAAFFRSRYADWIYRSDSSDGCHWSAPVPTPLPNNNSSIQAARLKDGHWVMAFNNAHATSERGKPGGAPRKILSVALSIDGGKTWPWVRDVQAGNTPPAFLPGEDSEYSYPSIVQTPDGMIQLTFSFRRETIKYMTFDEQWIKQGATAGLFKGDPR